MRFIGDTAPGVLRRLREALRQTRAAPFILRADGLGLFARRTQSVLWAGLEPSEQLSALKERIDQVLCDARIEVEAGRFSPHITLGRTKNASPADLRRFIEAHGAGAAFSFPVTSFVLCSSVLTPGGAVHAPLELYPFA